MNHSNNSNLSMLSIIKQIFNLLSPEQKKRFYILQIMVILMAITEIIGVISIIPFMTLIGDMNQLQNNTLIHQLYSMSKITSESTFVFWLGVIVLLILLTSSIFSMFTMWKLSMFGHEIGAELSSKLYIYYLEEDWLFHSYSSSANLTKKISIEASRVASGIIVPLMQMTSRLGLALLLIISIFIYNPKIVMVGSTIFIIAYFFLFRIVREKLRLNGESISKVNEHRFRLMNEGFGGIKDILILGRKKNFIYNFKKMNGTLSYNMGTNTALANVPRYFMEMIAFGAMITLILYLIATHNANLGIVLPILSVYALATFKLLPAFQQIYASFSVIKGNVAAFESIRQDLFNSQKCQFIQQSPHSKSMSFEQQLTLKNISFNYPNKSEPALKNLNLSIPVNNVVGLVGASGSGKSTIVSIILGLIYPQQGKCEVDGVQLNKNNCRSWQNNIFLTDASVSENVAFGIPRKKINNERVEQALKLAHLNTFIDSLEKGVDTKVGERGIQLSGGQKQRIGIARALYHNANVLLFDEATSSLDGLTEKSVMQAINNFKREKTIIIVAHRLKTVVNCDTIFFIDKGKVIDQGTYDELFNNNEKFKNLAIHA
jgi:HlyD family secretion protein